MDDSLRAVSQCLAQRKLYFLQLLKSHQVAGKPPYQPQHCCQPQTQGSSHLPPSSTAISANLETKQRRLLSRLVFKLSSSQKPRSDWIADSPQQRGDLFSHLLQRRFPILAASHVPLCSGWPRLPRQGTAQRSGGYRGESHSKGLESPPCPWQDGSGGQCTKIGCEEIVPEV